jgi:hypothetical protein
MRSHHLTLDFETRFDLAVDEHAKIGKFLNHLELFVANFQELSDESFVPR